MKKIRFGVIGCGSIANEYHLPALQKVDGAELVWACDIIEERAKNAQKDFGFQKYTLCYEDILNDKSIDAVCIFTKIEMHATLCIEAAKAHKHIFTQKPFAYNIEEGRKIINTVEACGVKLTPSFMHSYMDGSIAARDIISKGILGDIRHIRMRNATKNPFDSAPSYGGCMMDIGCHGMDLIKTVANSSIESVFALSLSPNDTDKNRSFGEKADLNGTENTAILNYRLLNGATVFHEIFWTQIAKTNRFEMEIYGTKGSLYLYNPHRSDIVFYGFNEDGHARNNITWQEAKIDTQFFGYIQHKTFVDDLLNGTSNSKTARDAFVPLQVVEAARRSAISGKIETVLGI
ncbi:MAG: Gfo/Idh/MocA family oxidoreductase [Oscillospiraceae bacterium]